MELRTLTTSDIPAAMVLVEHAGWNQTPRDWQRFLDASPDGCFAAIVGDRLVGTSATIVYAGGLAWIGMVLVDPAYRRRGIGGQLMAAADDRLTRAGIPCVKLDATPAGEPLYTARGFGREQLLERWELDTSKGVVSAFRRTGPHTSELTEQAIALDAAVFGADRRALLRSIAQAAPDLAMELREGGDLRGYTLGRRGLFADYLGPWMACDETAAARLLDEFLARSSRPRVFVDCVIAHPFGRRLLEARGFTLSRPLTRMRRGQPLQADDRDLLAIAGPEFG